MKQIEGWCGWCGKRFLWTPPSPTTPIKRFCGPKHKERARAARQRLKTHLEAGRCATPDKKRYLTRQAAEQVLIDAPTRHKGACAYECPGCGFFHLGHIPKGVHDKTHAERNRFWHSLTEAERDAIRQQAYEEKMARRAAREGANA